MAYSVHFMFWGYVNFPNDPMGCAMIPTLQTKDLRLREVKSFAHGHSTGKK